MTEFEWDENRRLANLVKHRIDFLDARALFDGRPTVTSKSPRDGEERNAATGYLNDACVTVIWTPRGEEIRFISVRRARDGEKREYRSIHGS